MGVCMRLKFTSVHRDFLWNFFLFNLLNKLLIIIASQLKFIFRSKLLALFFRLDHGDSIAETQSAKICPPFRNADAIVVWDHWSPLRSLLYRPLCVDFSICTPLIWTILVFSCILYLALYFLSKVEQKVVHFVSISCFKSFVHDLIDRSPNIGSLLCWFCSWRAFLTWKFF